MVRLVCASLVASLWMATDVSAQQPSAPHLERFLQRSDAPVTSYRAIRRMEARSERFNKDGWIAATRP